MPKPPQQRASDFFGVIPSRLRMQNQYMGMKIKNLHEKDFRMQKLNETEALEDEKKK